MPKGKKKCEQCGSLVGPRTQICSCGFEFSFKPRFLKTKTFNNHSSINFRDLKKDDVVYIKRATGPYWFNEETQERVALGYSGKVKVRSVSEDGFSAWSEREGCFAFIYMGEKKPAKNGVTILAPHKIRKVSPKTE